MSRLALALGAALVAGALVYWFLSGSPRAPEGSSVSVSTETSAPPAPAPAPVTSAATSTKASVATATATGTAGALSAAEFGRLAERVQTALPTVDKMRALKPEEVEHRTPNVLLEAGAQIGDVADALEKNPSLAPQGTEFYGKCARRGEVDSTVRALCLSNLRALARSQGAAADEQGIPPEVVKMADELKTSAR